MTTSRSEAPRRGRTDGAGGIVRPSMSRAVDRPSDGPRPAERRDNRLAPRHGPDSHGHRICSRGRVPHRVRCRQRDPLANGKFSIPTGLGRLGAEPPNAGRRVVTCEGSPRSCRARISLAGGARNREIVIRLTSSDLSLRSVTSPPRQKRPAYSLTDGHFAQSSSEYVVTLNAPAPSPSRSHLILTFG